MSEVEVSFNDVIILVDDEGQRFKLRFTSMSSYPTYGSMSKKTIGTRVEVTLEGFAEAKDANDCDLGI